MTDRIKNFLKISTGFLVVVTTTGLALSSDSNAAVIIAMGCSYVFTIFVLTLDV